MFEAVDLNTKVAEPTVPECSLHGAARKGETHAIARYLQDIECDPNERIVYRRCGFFFNYVKILEGVW